MRLIVHYIFPPAVIAQDNVIEGRTIEGRAVLVTLSFWVGWWGGVTAAGCLIAGMMGCIPDGKFGV